MPLPLSVSIRSSLFGYQYLQMARVLNYDVYISCIRSNNAVRLIRTLFHSVSVIHCAQLFRHCFKRVDRQRFRLTFNILRTIPLTLFIREPGSFPILRI